MAAEASTHANDWYTQAERSLMNLAEAVRSQTVCSLAEVQGVAADLVALLARDEVLFVRALTQQNKPSLIGNMIHTAIFATMIGQRMECQRRELDRIAFAALVHDVGMFRLSDELLTKAGRWSDDDLAHLRRHPTLGSEWLARAAVDDPWLHEVVEQEHERVDGSGYPHGLRGAQVHGFAQIIAIADVLDALLRSRPTRKALQAHAAVRLLVSREKAAFSGDLLKILIQVLSVFPVGTHVRLSSGEIGRVIRTDPGTPLRPVVALTVDGRGSPLPAPRLVDLRQDTELRIIEIVDTTRWQ